MASSFSAAGVGAGGVILRASLQAAGMIQLAAASYSTSWLWAVAEYIASQGNNLLLPTADLLL